MSTHDVPGAKVSNNDELKMGCWAEHEDGSLILVESTEANRVVFSIFDMSQKPPVEYRHAMREEEFKRQFSWNPSDPTSVKWIWHDKTPFNFDRVMKAGIKDGSRFVSVRDHLTAAQRVAESLHSRVYDDETPQDREARFQRMEQALEQIRKENVELKKAMERPKSTARAVFDALQKRMTRSLRP